MKFPYIVILDDPKIGTKAEQIVKNIIASQDRLRELHDTLEETREALWSTLNSDSAIDSDKYVYRYDGDTNEIECVGTMEEVEESMDVSTFIKHLQ